MKILIVRISAIGDIFNTLTVLPYIKSLMPDALIDWFVDENYGDIVRACSLINNVITIPLIKIRKSKLTFIQNLIAYKKTITEPKYDFIIDMQGLLKSGFLAKYCFNGPIYGLDIYSIKEKLACLFYKKRYNVNKSDIAVIRFNNLVSSIIQSDNKIKPTLNLNLANFPQYGNNYIMFIHGTSGKEKELKIDTWVSVANWILGTTEYDILLGFSNEAEYQFIQDFYNMINKNQRIILLPKLSILEFASIVQNAKLAIGVDTGFTHLASLMNVPTIALHVAKNPVYAGTVSSDISVNITDVSSTNIITTIQLSLKSAHIQQESHL